MKSFVVIGDRRVDLDGISSYREVPNPIGTPLLEIAVGGTTIHIGGTIDQVSGWIKALDRHFGSPRFIV